MKKIQQNNGFNDFLACYYFKNNQNKADSVLIDERKLTICSVINLMKLIFDRLWRHQ